MKSIDLGCGDVKQPGFTHYLDKFNYGYNLVFDLEKGKNIPFKNCFFDRVYCKDVLEHLNNVEFIMREIHRISKKGGIVEIIVPYYRHPNAVNPLHKRYFSWQSFGYWYGAGKELILEGLPEFRLINREWVWEDKKLEYLIGGYARKNPLQYEKWLAVFLPARRIRIVLRKD